MRRRKYGEETKETIDTTQMTIESGRGFSMQSRKQSDVCSTSPAAAKNLLEITIEEISGAEGSELEGEGRPSYNVSSPSSTP